MPAKPAVPSQPFASSGQARPQRFRYPSRTAAGNRSDPHLGRDKHFSGAPHRLGDCQRGAAQLCDAGADFEVHDNAVKNRDLLAKKMTPEQIAEAKKLVQAWKAR